jgi:hypothetical protein
MGEVERARLVKVSEFQGFRVSRFQSFKVSEFQGFRVSGVKAATTDQKL